jgi:release factor glutamine methyltransferase
VLIPRPETEQVVEAALSLLNEKPTPRVLDIGTGSGCIPLAIKKERPDAVVYACDVSTEVLAVATRNAEEHDLALHFFQADTLTTGFLEEAPDQLDLLISNPPYIVDEEGGSLDREVRDYEPHLALFAGDDPLLFYRAITRHAATLLARGGWLVFETHAHHADKVVALMKETNFDRITLKNDLAGLPRIVQGQRNFYLSPSRYAP